MDKKYLQFSIIIPVYKVEKYLDRCVKSIVDQKYKNYEVILVDDGSPDKCPDICDKWAEEIEYVKVIHKKNGGSSSARNAGVQSAKGEYILFVDSDDYWNNNFALSMIAATIERLKAVDVIVFNNVDFSCFSGKSAVCNRKYDITYMETAEKNDVLNYLFHNNLFPGAAWVTVTRKEFLLKNNISFIEGIKAEDIDWLLNVFINANNYSALNEAFYVYLKYRDNSITSTADLNSIKNILHILDIWIERLHHNGYDEISDGIYNYLCIHFLSAVLAYGYVKNKNKKMYKYKLKEYKYLCRYSNSIFIRISEFLPLPILSRLLTIYRKMKRCKLGWIKK